MDIEHKHNEISTLPELLKLIDISDSVITADAIYCQKDTTKQFTDKNAHYILALKNNHKTLYDDVKLWLDTNFDIHKLSVIETIDKDHGRLETRRYALSTQLDWLSNKEEWTNLNAVVMVESIREIKDSISTERKYYLSSLTDIQTITNNIRNHWSIEKSQHWVLDVIFGEDNQKSLARNEKANKALLTRTAVNLIQANGDSKRSIRRNKNKVLCNRAFLEKLLFGEDLSKND